MTTTTTVPFRKFALPLAGTLLVVGLLIFAGIRLNMPASADQYDDKINALQEEMEQYQAEANRLSEESTSLQNAIAQLNNEKKALQTQIDLSQAEYDKLTLQIKETEVQIKTNQDTLGQTVADIYVGDDISPVEILASSSSISDYIDKQEYRNSVRDELSSTIKKIKTLKQQLSEQKDEVEKVLDEQKTARASLQDRVDQQSQLLSQTQNDEAAYQELIKDRQDEIEAVKAAQAELQRRMNNTGGGILIDAGSLSSYPWNESNCPMWGYLSTGGSDGNGGDGYGYGCRQCASYVAWRVARETGIYYRWGNGGDFAANSIAAGYTDLGSSPQPGSLAVMWGNPGHVAWVESVSDNGATVVVSQYNWNYGSGWGMYSEMELSSTVFDQYVKIK